MSYKLENINCCDAICVNGSRCKYNYSTYFQNKRYCKIHYNIMISKNESCPICLEPLSIQCKTKLHCTHSFHTKCLTAWVREDKDTCPNCRMSIHADLLTRMNKDVMDYIGFCIYSFPKEFRKTIFSRICQIINTTATTIEMNQNDNMDVEL